MDGGHLAISCSRLKEMARRGRRAGQGLAVLLGCQGLAAAPLLCGSGAGAKCLAAL